MSQKYELMVRDRTGLCRIRALRNIPEVGIKAGDVGGYVQSEENLSQEGNCWVFRDAKVYGDARVCGNAFVKNRHDLFVAPGLGSCYRSTTFFREPTKISVVCGCFCGTLEEFRKKVRETHGNNKFAREYELACQLAELHILEKEKQA